MIEWLLPLRNGSTRPDHLISRPPIEERIPCLRRDGEIECRCQRSHVGRDEIGSLDIVFGDIDRW